MTETTQCMFCAAANSPAPVSITITALWVVGLALIALICGGGWWVFRSHIKAMRAEEMAAEARRRAADATVRPAAAASILNPAFEDTAPLAPESEPAPANIQALYAALSRQTERQEFRSWARRADLPGFADSK